MQKRTQLGNAGIARSAADTQAGTASPAGWARHCAARTLRIVLAGMWFALVAQCALAVVTTTVVDTLYLADGSVASGTVLISWPAFTTASGEAVPGGSTTVMVGVDGVLRVALAPNAGATPEGAYYTVVMHLKGGASSMNGNLVTTEYWVIPAATTTTLAAIRSKVMPVTRAIPINAGLASTAGLVQRAGDTMQGPLTLSGDPVTPTQASSKHYVDTAVTGQQALIDMAASAASDAKAAAAAALAAANGALPKTGGRLTGTLTLAANPAGNLEAATKQYVDAHAGSGASLPATSALIRGNGVGGGAVASRADVESTLGYVPLPASGTYDLNRDCGAAADYYGDAFTAHDNYLGVQDCLNTHPGGTFVAGAGTYYFSRELVRGQGQTIYGKGTAYNGTPGFRGDGAQTGTTFFFAAGSNGIHLQGGGGLHDLNIVNGDGGPRQATIDQAPLLILPDGQYLSQWIEPTLTLSRASGVVTATTLYQTWWNQSGIIRIVGATPASFNGTFYIDTAVRPGTNSTLTWAQAGADETATVQATMEPATTGTEHGSGVMIEGAGEHVWNVDIANFSNSCFEVTGGPNGTFIADDVRFEDSYTEGCRVNGVSILGGEDTSKGSYHHINNNFNQIYGTNAQSFLGDGVYDFQNSYNALSYSPPPGNAVNLAGCASAGSVVTCQTATAHGLSNGNGAVIAGTSNAAYNLAAGRPISCFVATVPDATHFTCTLPNTVADGASTGGTVRLPSGDEFLRGFGADSGAYAVGRHGLAGHSLILAPYDEGGQGTHNPDGCAMRYNDGDLILQPHSGNCISPAWTGSVISSDGNSGLTMSGAQFTMSAGAYHFKGFGGGADIATINGNDGSFTTTGPMYPGGRLGVQLDNTHAFYIFNAAGNHFNFCTSTQDFESIFNYPGSSCSYKSGTPFQVYSSNANGDQSSATVGQSLQFNEGVGGNNPNLSMADFAGPGSWAILGESAYSGLFYDEAQDFYFIASPKSDFTGNTVGKGGVNIAHFDHANNYALTMSKPLVLAADPAAAMQAATKQYVDAHSGGTAAVYAPSVTPGMVAAGSCADQTVLVTGLLPTDILSQIAPPAALGNVSMNAYASAADTLTLHFCNASAGSVTPPAGVYRFRATQ